MKRSRAYSRRGLLVWVIVCFLSGYLGSIPVGGVWYNHINKPWWTPSDWIYAPVWSMLYLAMALAAWQIWKKRCFPEVPVSLGYFLFQLLLGALWPWFFFGMRSPGFGLVGVTAYCAALGITLVRFWRIERRSGMLLIPCMVWSVFAWILNYSIWQLN